MRDEGKSSELDSWQSNLGLLPIPLFEEDQARYVLLNGEKGNFCLDLRRETTEENKRSIAWSSNVGHYIQVKGDYVEIQRWNQNPSSVERYTYNSVHQNLEKFHDYLERTTPGTGESVVVHATNIFRGIRNALGRDFNGQDALEAFLSLLACEASESTLDTLSPEDWGLNPESINMARQVGSNNWEALREQFRTGRPESGLRPYIDLVLRHSSGQIFQEAHYEAIFDQPDQLELDLVDVAPEPVEVETGKGRGVHFTPGALARTLVEESLAEIDLTIPSLTIFDPACGSGEFLRESLRQLHIRGYDGDLHVIGWDTSRAACNIARFSLAWEAKHSRLPFDFKIRQVDSLQKDWPKSDLLIMNPPFVAWNDMSEAQRSQVEDLLGGLFSHRPDFSLAFIWKAFSHTDEGPRVIGTILPASFFDSKSAAEVRGEMSNFVNPALVARLGSHNIFPAATVDAGLMVATIGKSRSNHPVAFWADHRPESNSEGLRTLRKSRYRNKDRNVHSPIDRDGFSLYPNPDLGKDQQSWNPRPYAAWKKAKKLEGYTKVKDIFDVKQGARTGNNDLFLIDSEDYTEIPDTESDFFRPAVVNDSIVNGVLNNNMYVFYPHGKSEIESENELKEKVPTFFEEVLSKNKEILLDRYGIGSNNWWKLSEHRTWQEYPNTKLVSTYFGSRGSYSLDKHGNFVVVQGIAWLTRDDNDHLTEDILLSYVALLNSPFFFDILPSQSNHTGGGQWNLSTKFVEELPLPDLRESDDHYIIKDLSFIGDNIINNGLSSLDLSLDEYYEISESAYGIS